MKEEYPLTWDLDVFYEGGSGSSAFQAELKGIQADIKALEGLLNRSSAAMPSYDELQGMVELMQSLLLRLRQSDSFVGCLLAQNMKDTAAVGLNDRVKTLMASYQGVLSKFDNQLRVYDDTDWQELLEGPAFQELSFNLNERRELAKSKMSPELEALTGDLAVDGYHGWGDYYNLIVSRTKFNAVDSEGKEVQLSAGQMQNRLSDGSRDVRKRSFAEWERVWAEQAELCAEVLNRIAGFRLKLYERRGWHSVLQEPLAMGRMTQNTLDAMWSAVSEGKKLLMPYFERKAKLLGVDKLAWHDVEAPIGSAARVIPYDEACAFIVDQFRTFSPNMADFADNALRGGWIEAENRSGKRPGGFCTAFPKSGQTRIFMTYSGSSSNLSTLAHELGHAYHQHVMQDMPALAQEYAMNVAETASTFAEMIVADSALKAAAADEKLGLVEDKIQRAVSFFMNIHARFIFETAFYDRRKEGMVTAEELCAMMEEAQQEAFCGILGETHPHFWASKLHFYLTDVPFYNFPYTFGYLFSSGIYARALAEGPAFADKYVALLRDTGRKTVEQLAQDHLGVDLEKRDFWDEAVALIAEDVALFLEMTSDK